MTVEALTYKTARASGSLRHCLINAVVIEAGAVFTIQAFDMVDVTASEGAEQRAHRYSFSVLHAMGGLNHLRQHAVVFGPVVGQAGKATLLHQLLFAPEVHARELDQPVEDGADLFPAATAYNSLA